MGFFGNSNINLGMNPYPRQLGGMMSQQAHNLAFTGTTALGGASNIRSDKVTQVQRELIILDNKIIDVLCQVYDRNLIVALLDIRNQVEIAQTVNLAPKPEPKPEPKPVTKYQQAIKCKQLGGPDPFGRNVAIPKTNTVHLIEYQSDDKPDEYSAIKALCGAKTTAYDWFTNPYRWRFLTDDDIGDPLPEFSQFAIKIVMQATDAANPPRIKDLRVLALAT